MELSIETPNGSVVSFPNAEFPIQCAVFALCDREAVQAIHNPILGAVPACERCATKMEELA
jgi:hypothetical protein